MIVVAPLAVLLLVTLVGAALKEAKRPIGKRGATVVGTAALFAFLGLLWRRRGLVLDGAAVSVLVIIGLGVGAVWWTMPERRLSIVAPAVAGVCTWLVVKDWQLTRGGSWRPVLSDLRRADAAQRAVAVTHPDAKAGAVRVRGGRVEVPVEHVGPVDVERVGQVLHAPHTSLVAGSEMGRATVVVHDAAPPVEVDPWVALSVAHRWPGCSSTVPDADIPVGVDVHGRFVNLPFPGAGGKHLLIGGSTGSGKSVLLSVILAELAYRPHMRFMLGDPKHVELAMFQPRAAELAKGAAATGKLLDDVHAEMMSRYQALEKKRRRQFVVGDDGDQIMLVIDELASVTSGQGSARRVEAMTEIIAMGRAAAVGLICCTQRPSHKLVPTDLRDNFRSRVGLGCESADQTEMIMGSRLWPCEEIPPSLPGVAYVRIDRAATLCRSFLLTDDDVDRVAAATAHLKGA